MNKTLKRSPTLPATKPPARKAANPFDRYDAMAKRVGDAAVRQHRYGSKGLSR